ncbi:MAG: hypothetical protein CMF74_18825 [Maricaulis sp.]|nr:hypothetical protein [Maricaulis sp.]
MVILSLVQAATRIKQMVLLIQDYKLSALVIIWVLLRQQQVENQHIHTHLHRWLLVNGDLLGTILATQQQKNM